MTKQKPFKSKRVTCTTHCSNLWALGIKHVFVEGGPKLASAFVAAKLVDEFIVYLAPKLLGGPNTALGQIGVARIEDAAELQILETRQLGNDIFIRARSA